MLLLLALFSPFFQSLVQCMDGSHILHSLPGNSNVHITRNYEHTSPFHSPTLRNIPNTSPFHPSTPVETAYSPFNPRFAVQRNEISDEEWEEELYKSFKESGLIPKIISRAPPFLINVNFGNNECVHMGTELRAEDSAYPPTSLSFPTPKNNGTTYHTLLMLDVDHHNWLHWMLVNIPGNDFRRGVVITDYIGPTPRDNLPHRYVLLAMKQKGWFQGEYLKHEHGGGICDTSKRGTFNLDQFKMTHQLSEPIAANYFRVRYNPFIDSIIQFCRT